MEEKKQKNLKHLIVQGTAASVKASFGDSYISPYAVALGADNVQIGFLSSLPDLVGSISQLLSSDIVEVIKSRKKTITTTMFMEGLIWIPIFLVFLLTYKVWFLIFFVTIYWTLMSIKIPVWRSLMGDIVPDSMKARYFSKRNKIIGFSGFVSLLMAGIILQFFSKLNTILGFGIIFSVAMIARFVSLVYSNKLDEPKYVEPKETKFSFIDFIKRMKTTNYGIFVIYRSLLDFSVRIASPFFVVYMLKDLNFSYFTYTIVSAASAVPKFLSMTTWGKLSDRFGNKNTLMFTSFLIPFVPILWLLSINIWYLILIQIFAGLFWAGFDLSSFNFVYDTVSPPKRIRCVSYLNVLSGIGIFFGALIGGFLVRFGTMFWSTFYIVFLASGILRLLMAILFLPKIREVKEVEKISGKRLLWVILGVDVAEGLMHPIAILRKGRIRARRPFEIMLRETKKFLENAFKK